MRLQNTMKIQRAHQIRLYPKGEQFVQLAKSAGTARYAHNWALDKWITMYQAVEDGTSTEKPSAFKLCNIWTEEKPGWADEVSSSAPRRAIMDVGVAFGNLIKGNARHPQFHKKGRRESFYVDNTKAYIKGDIIHLPKIGKVKMAEELRYSGKIMSYTVSEEAGMWFVSVQVEIEAPEHPCVAPDSVVGIDVGLATPATASDGTTCVAPAKLKRLEKNLKQRQRKLSKARKGSKNRSKLLRRKQKVQHRINNIRKDATHKFTATITKSHGVVVVEDLNIAEMKSKSPAHLRRSLQASMMGEIIRQLSYKALHLIKAPRYYPSTKRCSKCGNIRDEIGLSERTYICPVCGLTINRDLNAAVNLMNVGAVYPELPVECVASNAC
jgi:putative transposase